MTFELTIRGASSVAPGLWTAKLEPSHVRLVGGNAPCVGSVSVLLLTESPRYNPDAEALCFGPKGVRVLNVGTTESAVLVLGADCEAHTDEAHTDGTLLTSSEAGTGDQEFLGRLTPQLRDLGVELLKLIRREFPGSLRFHPRSGKFVESPDNFWTVRIQPRDRSFRITVRGTPERFPDTRLIRVVPDMGSYSSFKVSRAEQLDEALAVIRQAHLHWRARPLSNRGTGQP
jgi:hypothetical protein